MINGLPVDGPHRRVIVRMDDIGMAGMWADAPKIARWFEALRSHPAYRPAYYFGSLLTEKYPELRAELAAGLCHSPVRDSHPLHPL